MSKCLYFTAYHRGGLKECLDTEVRISYDLFKRLRKAKIYQLYCYDERIGAKRYLIYSIEKNCGIPQWINVYPNLRTYNDRLKKYGY